jgi:hypothetical protein
VLQLGDGGVAALQQAEEDLGGVELAELGGLGEREHGALAVGESESRSSSGGASSLGLFLVT